MNSQQKGRSGPRTGLALLASVILLASAFSGLAFRTKADDQSTQAIQTIDLATTTANINVLGANNDDHLSGDGDPNSFAPFPRAHALATGDFNGDNIADLAIGAPEADFTPSGGANRPNAGAVYIIFGRANFANPTLIDTNTAAVSQPDVRVFGASADDNLGFALAAGDVNGDGNTDLLMGAPAADFNATTRVNTGAVYVIFGGTNVVTGNTRDLATAPTPVNVTIFGSRNGDEFGSAVASANLGGPNSVADILIGAPGNDGPNADRNNAGAAYIIFGSTTIAGANGIIDVGTVLAPVRLLGRAGSLLGSSVAIGDVNGGGAADAIVGAPGANRPGPPDVTETGAVFVVFGGTNIDPVAPQTSRTFDLNSAAAADRPSTSIYGATTGDHLGASVATADVTSDGTVDLVAGAPDADGRNDLQAESGEAYVLTGGSNFNPPAQSTERIITISTTTAALTVYGSASGDHLGAVVAGAVVNTTGNNDTVADFLIGAPGFDATSPTRSNAGEVSVIFGGATLLLFAERDLAIGQDDIRVLGAAAGDELGWAVGAGDLDNNRGGDLIMGAPFRDAQVTQAVTRPNAGQVYAILAAPADVPPLNQAPTVTVVAPNGAEVLVGGATFNITWTASDPNGDATIQRFEIRLSTDQGATFNTIIAPNLPGTARTFTWTVPIGVNTTLARVRIIATDNAGAQGQDDSNANFAITDVGVTVTLTAPNGGERLSFGATFNITWTVPIAIAGQVTGFDLFLSTNGGTTFPVPIAFTGPLAPALPTGQRSFAWTVPSICTDMARVLVVARLVNGSESTDGSNANFSISEPGPTLNPGNMSVNGANLVLRTTQPATGTEIRFREGVIVEITNAAGVFVRPNKVRIKGTGGKLVTKGSWNGVGFNEFFPDQATRTLRVINTPCGITELRVQRQGNNLVVVTTAQAQGISTDQPVWP
jgi:FG-GAP repeat protein